ncbi:MAG TPA: YXWGXW repeat-containing protein [Verrucomicrobiae bacterium]|nr:YXWGXW repeat-containing protein [Verrucomicrobiae bacterium]
MRLGSVRGVLLALVVLALSTASFAAIGITVSFGPPALPVYEQPVCPGDGYIWTPGYWAWNGDGYFWVPGTWVLPPEAGYLWTPPWWGWDNGVFLFHEGYWGSQVGFYGGINYGFGYFGNGFEGGRWDHGHFFYNRAVTNVNVVNIHNVYNETVVNRNVTVNRVSYNGGQGGITARPTREQDVFDHGHHVAPVASQMQHEQEARGNERLRAEVNHGKPPIAATDKPRDFSGHEAVAAKEAGAPYRPPESREHAAENNRPANARPENAPSENGRAANPVHARELPPVQHEPAPNTGNSKLNEKYAKQQNKLEEQQQKQRQKLSQQQEKEDQRLARNNANDQRKQQMEQRHQQQTQQLQQREEQQRQRMTRRQAPPPHREKPPKK